MFSIKNGLKQGDALSSLLFHHCHRVSTHLQLINIIIIIIKFTLEYAMRRIRVNQDA
jgi:hypothetical protein